MRLLRLSGRKTCERVKTKGYLWKGKHFFVRYLSGVPRNVSSAPSSGAIYVGTLTSTKLHKSAVKRNRMRRRCREALRVSLQGISESKSLVSKSLVSKSLVIGQQVTGQQVTGHSSILSGCNGPATFDQSTSDLRPVDQRPSTSRPATFDQSTSYLRPATSFQLLLLPRSSSLSADFGELTKDAEHLLASFSSRAR